MTLSSYRMRRVARCLVVLCAIAAAWIGCRDDYGVEDYELGLDPGIGTGTGSDGSDASVDDAPTDGSDGSDAAVDDAPIDGSNGSGSDAGPLDGQIDAPGPAIDAPGPPIDAPGPPIDAPGPPIDAPGPPIDAGGGGSMQGPGGDAGGTNDLRPLDRTSFYACAEGGCGSTTGAEVWLPLALAIGFALRRPRGRRRTGRATG
jgi:uncharacterized protein (TIGR03382 family)